KQLLTWLLPEVAKYFFHDKIRKEVQNRLRSFGSFGSFMKRAPRSYANSGAREFQFHAGQDTFFQGEKLLALELEAQQEVSEGNCCEWT
ncbi:MAG: hypothetical protein ACKPEY_10580, partial [Planctomycetota bacterium]